MLLQGNGQKPQDDPDPLMVDFNWLKAAGIFTNRVDAARKRAADFPAAVEMSPNRIGWHLHEVRQWLASRPRRISSPAPKARIAEGQERLPSTKTKV
jgi:hypothetical protein